MKLAAAQSSAIRRAFPETGDAFVARYPDILRQCVDRWHLKLTGEVGSGMPVNVVLFAERDNGDEVVLKITHPNPESRGEIVALEAYGGDRAVRLLASDEQALALVVARIRPGVSLRYSPRRHDTAAFVQLFAELGWPCDHYRDLPTYERWLIDAFAGFRRRHASDHPFHEHIDRAERLFASLDSESWFLHGDLHHENLLEGDNGRWVVIDPKGVIGPRVMECGRFLHNFLQDEIKARKDELAQMATIVEARCESFADVMNEPTEVLAMAGYIDAVLGTCWTLNDGDSHPAREVAAIARLVPA